MATPYNVYVLSNSLPPVVVFVVTSPFAFVFVISVFLYVIGKLADDFLRKHKTPKLKIPCLSGMYAAVSVLFRDALKKKVVGGETIYLLFRRKINPLFILSFVPLVPGLFSCFFTTFWEVFLTEESFTCDPGLDCFPFSVGNLSILQNDPIVNCSDFATNDNVTITCYQFVFRYAAATGLVGGLLTVTALGVKVVGGVLIWSMDLGEEHTEKEEDETQECYKCKSCCRHCYAYLKLFVSFTLALLPILASIVASVIVLHVPLLRDAVFGTRERRVQFVSYIILSFYLGLLVPVLTMVLARSKPYESVNIIVNINAQNGDLEAGQGSGASNGTSIPQDSEGVPHSGTLRVPLLSIGKHSQYGT